MTVLSLGEAYFSPPPLTYLGCSVTWPGKSSNTERAHQKHSTFYRTRPCLKWELCTEMQQHCTGKVSNTGKSHSSVFTNMNFLWAVLHPQNTSMMLREASFPFFWMSAISLGNTNTLFPSPHNFLQCFCIMKRCISLFPVRQSWTNI